MSKVYTYKFAPSDQDEEEEVGNNFGGGFNNLVSVFDMSDNYIITLNNSYRQHHNLIYEMKVMGFKRKNNTFIFPI